MHASKQRSALRFGRALLAAFFRSVPRCAFVSSHARAFTLLVALLLFAPRVRAADLETEVSRQEVGVGESFQVQLSIPLEGDEEPSEPKLPVDGPAEVRGPSMGSNRSITMHNFSFSSQTKLVVTWTLTATAKGRIAIGPGTLRIGKKRLKGDQVVVSVTDTPRRSRRVIGRDPFDDFFSGDPFGGLQNRVRRPALPPPPADLVPNEAPDPIGFLRARLSKFNVVVGETLVLTVYAFGSRGGYQEANPVEPSLADFLTFREVQSSFEEQRYQTDIQGRTYQIAKLRQIVLVPLKAGELKIGPMVAILAGQGYPEKGNPIGYPVTSQELTVRVQEAPAQGRPKEFSEGDVGQFKMKVELRPTELVEGEYAELLVHLSGKGHLPTRVPLPEGPSWEWQDPSTVGEPEPENGELNGLRTLKVPLRVTRPGEIELGTIRLPYFDPNAGEYAWLEAKLPRLHVKPREVPAPSEPSPKPPKAGEKALPTPFDLKGLTKPRTELSPMTATGFLSARFWPATLALPPLSLGLYGAIYGLRLWASRRRRGSDQNRPLGVAKRQLKELKKLSPDSSGRIQLRKAIDAVLLARLGKTGRGMTAEELRRTLEVDGVSPSEASSVLELLSALDQAEFSGSAGMAFDFAAGIALLERLLRGRKGTDQ